MAGGVMAGLGGSFSRRQLLRGVALSAAGLGLAAGAAACTDPNSVSEQARRGDDKGFIAGDGTIEQLAPEQRGAPVELSGKLLDGTPWSMADAANTVLVLNVWGSWCEPCVAEAPELVQAADSLTAAHKDVRFLGINVGESPQTGAAGARALQLPYPSLSDEYRGLGPALQNKASATPTTLVLDRAHRIAARISGPITSPATLTNLVESVVAEGA
ncbi:thiol-disulfide isomerase/thioredoxin [Kineosphaera limosa]|uniref:Cytochrome c biogenesis protein ResA n=1 Tax=Kineosphaera limosa NBRC 100340 TaxID=1184609 RepID=K6WWI8_9MICO|nr:TlpA disulfide reductase family protein [Kineosphaera limosa]NYE01735.1 thiol-disulfide isomerase/thioredoxin [Kineosphaera limosa]GAB96467.1 cytochrome c biogenesis protein ResA [Kineosphaera limosa NBRC 100340]